jgi:hypothetical protein
MLEKLNEPIDILVKFTTSAGSAQGQKKVVPTFFKWRGKTYKIEKINLIHKERDGNDKKYYFSVSDNANFFRLAFSTRDLSWRIEELFFEG